MTQNTIDLDKNDSEYVLMTKTIILGTKLMVEAIKRTNADLATNKNPQNNGKLYQINDFNPKAIMKVKKPCLFRKVKAKNRTREYEINLTLSTEFTPKIFLPTIDTVHLSNKMLTRRCRLSQYLLSLPDNS